MSSRRPLTIYEEPVRFCPSVLDKKQRENFEHELKHVSLDHFQYSFHAVCTDDDFPKDVKAHLVDAMLHKMKEKDPDIANMQMWNGQSLINYSVANYLWYVFLTLRSHGAAVNCVDEDGNTLLHCLVISVIKGRLQEKQALKFLKKLTREQLLMKGVPENIHIDSQNECGETAVFLAVEGQLWNMFNFLLEIDADIDIECRGRTARSFIEKPRVRPTVTIRDSAEREIK